MTDIVCDIGDTILIPAKVSKISVFKDKKVEYRIELPQFFRLTASPYVMDISQDKMAQNGIKILVGEESANG